jgi:DNA recombination protein RmuC
MTAASLSLSLAAAFAAGAVLAWLVALLRRARQGSQLAAAEALATAERERRQSVERELGGERRRAEEAGRELAAARERLEQAQTTVAEQRAFVERSRKELEDAFGRVAAAVLHDNTEQFLALARERLQTTRAESASDLDERRAAIAALLQPLRDTLERLDGKTADLERNRVDAYSRIAEQVQMLAAATAALGERTTSLATALRGSQVRGRWGEIALKNVAEAAGMSEHCDFDLQATQDAGGRPDMVVHLPGGRLIAVDAKAPLAAYLEAVEATTDPIREAALERHSRDLRLHVKTLAGRDYAGQLGGEVDLVVLFLPGDPFLSAAFSHDPEIQLQALREKVLIATPSTLVALLRTVAIYWQQSALVENAALIGEVARQLYERAAKFSEDLGRVGKGLQSALDAYNEAVGSFNRRLLPMSQKLDQLKISAQTRRQIEELEPLDVTPREAGQAELFIPDPPTDD